MVSWRHHPAFPDDGPALLAAFVRGWAVLDDDERARLRADVEHLLRTKSWEAAQGFAMNDAMCTIVAAQAARMLVGTEEDLFRNVRAVVLHPTTIVSTQPRMGPAAGTVSSGPEHLLGQAHDRRGPILLAWDTVWRNVTNPVGLTNVVIHEFAHKIDMLDATTNGTPPLGAAAREQWEAACRPVYQALRRGEDDPLIRPYAATNRREFFAVATEVFFEQPAALAEVHPALYGVFRDYFGQDLAVLAYRGLS